MEPGFAHFKTRSVRAAALEKLTTLLDHKTVEQVRTKFHSLDCVM